MVAACGRSRNLKPPPSSTHPSEHAVLLDEKKLVARGGRLDGKWLLAVVKGLEAVRHLLDGELGEVEEGLHC